MKHKKIRKSLILLAIAILIAAVAVAGVTVMEYIKLSDTPEMTLELAQSSVDEQLAAIPNKVAPVAMYVFENTDVTVDSFEQTENRQYIFNCTYSTHRIDELVRDNINDFMVMAYDFYLTNKAEGKMTNATSVKLFVKDLVSERLSASELVTGEFSFEAHAMPDGGFKLYLDKDIINTVFGGVLKAKDIIDNTEEIVYDGEIVSIKTLNTLRTGVSDCIKLNNFESERPDNSLTIIRTWNSIRRDFERNFIKNSQWKYIAKGLVTTLEITALAVLIGIVIGFIVAIVRCTNQKTGKLEVASDICQLYLSVMRGTPLMVQLLIVYFVVLLPIGVERFTAAVICFGLNSGAYVSEIVRGGIMSVDEGQTEAGRSLGFTYLQTMWHIIIPQAFKSSLPALANEFITLLKESSVAFYIGVADLTQGGLKIRSITYSNFMPLVTVAIVYLILVLGLSKCVGILERRLRKGDNR